VPTGGNVDEKSPVTSLGIEPATFWLVAQCLNHLCHCLSLSVNRMKCLVSTLRDSSQQLMVMVTLGAITEEKEGKTISLFITHTENLENYIL